MRLTPSLPGLIFFKQNVPTAPLPNHGFAWESAPLPHIQIPLCKEHYSNKLNLPLHLQTTSALQPWHWTWYNGKMFQLCTLHVAVKKLRPFDFLLGRITALFSVNVKKRCKLNKESAHKQMSTYELKILQPMETKWHMTHGTFNCISKNSLALWQTIWF